MGLQENFLRSATPNAALDMRKRLKHWQAALDLAYALDPRQVVPLAIERAQVSAYPPFTDDAMTSL